MTTLSKKTILKPITNKKSSSTKYEEEDIVSESSDENSSDSDTISEISTVSRMPKNKVKSSPSQRQNKRREKDPLIEESIAPLANESEKYLPTGVPTNTIWVVKTATLPKPEIDKNTYMIERRLTKEEIDYIVDIIPMVPAAVPEIGCIIQQQIKNWISIQLVDMEIVPAGIEILRSEIEFNFYKSLMEPGKTIGSTCSESIGQPLTQITLSSFHQTGSASAGVSGVDSIREMLNISPQRKHEFSTIHFKDKNLTFDQAFEMQKHLSSLTLQDVTKKTTLIIVGVDNEDIYSRGWWYRLMDNLFEDAKMEDEDSDVLNAKVYLRLYLDVQKMYNAGVTIKEVAEAIDKSADEVSSCVCIYSPTTVGIIDIYPRKNVATVLKDKFNASKVKPQAYSSLRGETIHVIFLQRCIVNKMQEIIIKGIPGIRDIVPMTIKMTHLLKYAEPLIDPKTGTGIGNFFTKEDINVLFPPSSKKSKKVTSEPDFSNLWKIWIDFIKIRVSGVPISKLVKMIKATGLEVLYAPPDIDENIVVTKIKLNPIYSQLRHDCIIVRVSDEIKNTQIIEYDNEGLPKKSPFIYNEKKKFNLIEYINYFQNKSLNERDTYMRSIKGNDSKIIIEKDKKLFTEESRKFLLHAHYVYVEANGINMKTLLSNPYVDPSRCKCNNFHYMLETFDIEVTRNSYIREFYDHIINNGAFMNLKYLMLISEFVTCQGLLLPVTSRGVSRQNVGTFAKASFEHAMPTFIDAASMRKNENVKSTSTSIFVGRRAPIGSGLCQPIPDEVMIETNNRLKRESVEAYTENIGEIHISSHINFENQRLDNLDVDGVDLFSEETPFSVKIGTQIKHSVKMLSNQAINSDEPLCTKDPVPSVILTNIDIPPWVASIINNITNIDVVNLTNKGITDTKIITPVREKRIQRPLKKTHIILKTPLFTDEKDEFGEERKLSSREIDQILDKEEEEEEVKILSKKKTSLIIKNKK